VSGDFILSTSPSLSPLLSPFFFFVHLFA
jgi:hypothetical protein